MSEAVAPPPRRKNPTAVVGLVLGIIANAGSGLVGFFLTGLNFVYLVFPFLLGFLGLILSIVGAVSAFRPDGGRRGIAVAAVVLGLAPFATWLIGIWLGNVFIR